MSIYTDQTRRAVVRWEYSDCSTYRRALGGLEPLLALATDGPLDAPEYVPAGSQYSSAHGPMRSFAGRHE